MDPAHCQLTEREVQQAHQFLVALLQATVVQGDQTELMLFAHI